MRLNKDKTLSLLGLATKAGKVASGAFLTEKSVKSAKCCLVVLAGDASDNTRKKFSNMCRYYEVPLVSFGSKEQLGRAIGRGERSSLAVLDENFTKAILRQLEDGNQ